MFFLRLQIDQSAVTNALDNNGFLGGIYDDDDDDDNVNISDGDDDKDSVKKWCEVWGVMCDV